MMPQAQAPIQLVQAVGQCGGEVGRFQSRPPQVGQKPADHRLEIPTRGGGVEVALDRHQMRRRRRRQQSGPAGVGIRILQQRNRSAGETQLQVLGLIGIDGNVIRLPIEAAGDGVDQRILGPDAGVVQLGLVPGGDQRLVILAMPEPLPHVNVGHLFGLMEVVQDHRGEMDVFALDQLTDYDFGHTLAVVKAGEMLDLLDTLKNMVVLTDTGRKFVAGDINLRKTMFRERIKTLGAFRFVGKLLEQAPEKRLPKEIIEEELAVRLTTENVEQLFQTLVGWGRFAELFGYSTDTNMLYLDVEGPTAAS